MSEEGDGFSYGASLGQTLPSSESKDPNLPNLRRQLDQRVYGEARGSKSAFDDIPEYMMSAPAPVKIGARTGWEDFLYRFNNDVPIGPENSSFWARVVANSQDEDYDF